jgi:DNA repair exonuclease SbcCD ATPase subunit
VTPAEYRKLLTPAYAEYVHAQRTAAAETDNLAGVRANAADAADAQKILQEIAAGVQNAAHAQIARVVSKCLETVFDSPYEFRVVFEQKRGKTEARLAFVRDGREFDPITEAGGGVVDVAAFALRLAALVLSRPAFRRLLVLDEPMKMLSRDYAPRVRELLESLAADMGVQFLLVTHSPALACGKIIEIG